MGETAVCTAEGCMEPGRHSIYHGNKSLNALFCCAHADAFMARVALAVPAAEAATGLTKWAAKHDETCGPLVEDA